MFRVRMLLVVLVVACVAGTAEATVVFQEGLNGYASTRDDCITFNWGAELSRGAATTSTFGGVPWGGVKQPGFLAFDDIFGTGANQFNASWDITSATLKVFVYSKVFAGTSSYIQLWPMITPWAEGNDQAHIAGFRTQANCIAERGNVMQPRGSRKLPSSESAICGNPRVVEEHVDATERSAARTGNATSRVLEGKRLAGRGLDAVLGHQEFDRGCDWVELGQEDNCARCQCGAGKALVG